ncbi:hypothetical protein GGF31_005185 [Allomyces arbusculus]|nr:hypothetical protein GGF31_005185 [Allomyces arbusculus]
MVQQLTSDDGNMTIIKLDLALPAAPGDLLAGNPHASRAVGKLTGFRSLAIDIASPRTFEREDPHAEAALASLFGAATIDEFPDDDSDNGDDEADAAYLMMLTPRLWKKQDHYRVLGLTHLRYKANDEQVKDAYRRRVLKFHPDKLAARALPGVNIDDVFKCIQKAHETLADPVKRMQYDSVDPGMEYTLPSEAEVKAWAAEGEDVAYKNLAPYFVREGRFSKKQPVPVLGDSSSPRNEVEGFYDFWYHFDSWRSFEYEDNEDAETTDNRDNKRYLEKKNKAERARKKTEDNARQRTLVDLALKYDARMKRYKEEDKLAKKMKQQMARGGSASPAPSAAKNAAADKAAKAKAEEEAKKAAEAAAAAKKVADEAEKAAKKDAKAALKKEKKALKQLVTKDLTYLHESPSSQQMEATLVALEKLTLSDDVAVLTAAREKIAAAHQAGGIDAARAAFDEAVAAAKA